MDSPLLVFLDDLQWVDSGTVAALRALPERLACLPIGWVLAMRADQGPGQLRSTVAYLRRLRVPKNTDARAFSGQASVAQVAKGVMRAETDETAAHAWPARLGGNPFLLVDLLEGLRQENLVRVDSWACDAD